MGTSDIEVKVDGKTIGTTRPGSEKKFEVTPGRHEFFLQNFKRCLGQAVIDIDAKGPNHLEAGVTIPKSYGKSGKVAAAYIGAFIALCVGIQFLPLIIGTDSSSCPAFMRPFAIPFMYGYGAAAIASFGLGAFYFLQFCFQHLALTTGGFH